MGYGMKYTKGNVKKTGKGFPFKEEEELRDFTGDPTTEGTHFEKEVDLTKRLGLGPRKSFGGVMNPELQKGRELEDPAE